MKAAIARLWGAKLLMSQGGAGKAQFVDAGLSDAIAGWIVTEQAKGIVAERAGLDIEGAFTRMRAYARDHNANLVDVAHGLVDGTLNLDNDDVT